MKQEEGPSVYLQTCNRMELYYGEGDIPDDVARHLFRVTCGLESAIVGEKAVQGQVKEAYLTARNSGQKLPAELHKLFESALEIGKQVRFETKISHGAVSHSLAALELLKAERIDISNSKITIIGVNKLTADIVKFLSNKEARHVRILNRTSEKAKAIAETYQIQYGSLSDIRSQLLDTDVLISATSAPGYVVTKDDMPKGRQMLCIDLAFPRDIEPQGAENNSIRVKNLNDVEAMVRENLTIRESEIAKAEALIENQIAKLRETMQRRNRNVNPIRVIARSSRLSRLQVEEVFRRFPDVPHAIAYADSFGDKNLDISLLSGAAPDDMFTRELDLALLNGEADISVHSAKDLPTKLHPDLEVIALYEAFDKTDSLVSRDNLKLSELKPGSRIGTSSPLRRKEILALRPDVEIVDIRGCIESRVEQVRRGDMDAAIVATCALKRLGMESEIAEILPFATHPMQGRLAITALRGRDDLKEIFSNDSIL